jgi:tetratricopeptide (TPR) repeat protein
VAASEADPDFLEPSDGSTFNRAAGLVDSRRASATGIEGYDFLEEIHRGGQGVVFRALQRSTKRDVAVKVLLGGPWATHEARRRFEREVELVARLRHPHIVSVYDSGVTADGDPFLVMEYLSAERLDRYLARRGLGSAQILELFACVCDAVGAAHQKGILHRDLKPSNVLIDADGNPKLLDFGLAKTISTTADVTLVSGACEVLGTLSYMSPEQAAGRTEDIDTRTDVYSLGVILYEILAGRSPYPVDGDLATVLRHIAETPPARLSRSGGAARTIGAVGSPARSPVSHDLETIVFRCLEKDRDRRYSSAVELAQDLRRYLRGEAITARPSSFGYKLTVLARKHRRAVTTVGLVAAVLVASTAVSTWLYLKARAEAARANAIQSFLVEDVLLAASPELAGTGPFMLRDAIQSATQRLDRAMAGQPALAASLHFTVGRVLMSLGRYADASEHLSNAEAYHARVLGDNARETLQIRNEQAELLRRQDRLAEAHRLATQNAAAAEKALGGDDVDTLTAQSRLANVLFSQHRYREAEATDRRVLARREALLGPEHVDTLRSLQHVADSMQAQGNSVAAEPIYRRVLAAREDRLGDTHPSTLRTMNNLGALLKYVGRLSEAEAVHRQALRAVTQLFGETHPAVLTSKQSLASVLEEKGDYVGAGRLLKDVVESRRANLGPTHRDTAEAEERLVAVLCRQGKADEARPLTRSLLEQMRIAASADAAGLDSVNNHAWFLLTCEPADLRDPIAGLAQAERCWALAKMESKLAPRFRAQILDTLALAYQRNHRLADAVRTMEQALGTGLTESDSALRSKLEEHLVQCLLELGDTEAARPHVVRWIQKQRESSRRETASANALNNFAWLLLTCEPAELRAPGEALTMARRAAEQSRFSNPRILDTLAMAYSQNDLLQEAVDTQLRALGSIPPEPSQFRAELQTRLDQYVSRLGQAP